MGTARGMTKPQRKRLTSGRECERVQASGFSRPLQSARARPVSFTAKANRDEAGNIKGYARKKWRAQPVSVKGTLVGPGLGGAGVSQLRAPGAEHEGNYADRETYCPVTRGKVITSQRSAGRPVHLPRQKNESC